MAKLLKLRRGTTSQHSSFTGAEAEVTVDTDKETLVVHDGSTAGGHPVAAEDMANVSSANIAGRLGTDSIATTKIAAGALPTDVTVASANIVNGTIVGADIANDAIDSEHYATGSIDAAHIANNTITGTQIAPNAVGASELADDTVDTDAIVNDAVTYAKIQNVSATDRILGRISSGAGAIEELTPANLRTKLNVEDGATADQTSTEIKSLLAGDNIDSGHIGANSIGNSELGADAVQGGNIADDAINSEHYADYSIDHDHLSGNCVDGDNIQDDAIDSEHYVDRSIDAVHIATGTITANELAANSVGTSELGADCVTNAELADNCCNSNQYVDRSIDAVHIATGTITANELAANSVGTSELANNSVDSDHYVTASIDNAHLADDAVGVAELSASGSASSSTFLRGDNSWAATGGKFSAYAMIEDRKSDGTNGGTFSGGAWRTRDLNTEVTDPNNIVSISSNTFALSGSTSDKYLVRWRSPAYKVDVHGSRLYCTTDSNVAAKGSASVCKGNYGIATTISHGMARLDGGKSYRIEAYAWQTISGDGFGSTWSASWCPGIYAQVEIMKEA